MEQRAKIELHVEPEKSRSRPPSRFSSRLPSDITHAQSRSRQLANQHQTAKMSAPQSVQCFGKKKTATAVAHCAVRTPRLARDMLLGWQEMDSPSRKVEG